MKPIVSLCLSALLILVCFTSSHAQGDKGQYHKISLAAINLPEGIDGPLHWIGSESTSQPLELSTRYFSDYIEPKSPVIRFYAAPTTIKQGRPLPEPLFSLTVPAGPGLQYVVIFTAEDKDGKVIWRSRGIDSEDWKFGTMKLINGSATTLGLSAGERKFKLEGGTSMDFAASSWKESFPVKIFLLEPKLKTVFSSTWRVTGSKRELCFLAENDGMISIRALMDLAAPPAPEE